MRICLPCHATQVFKSALKKRKTSVEIFARKYRIKSLQTTRRLQASETLCRKGGTSRSDNAPHASGACAGAKLACGATLSATREFWSACAVAQTFQPPLKRPLNL
jgi:hypothetical protein